MNKGPPMPLPEQSSFLHHPIIATVAGPIVGISDQLNGSCLDSFGGRVGVAIVSGIAIHLILKYVGKAPGLLLHLKNRFLSKDKHKKRK